ncbi:MAG: hypothetical protein SX243_08070 [Acidobacteriota bacterium]|nr:hypothetical protein [Acidobacteriota bacterium]
MKHLPLILLACALVAVCWSTPAVAEAETTTVLPDATQVLPDQTAAAVGQTASWELSSSFGTLLQEQLPVSARPCSTTFGCLCSHDCSACNDNFDCQQGGFIYQCTQIPLCRLGM